jgi:hypothetical protein
MPLHRGLNESKQMKRSSTKKNYLVVMLDEFNNVWIDKTIPATELQCIRYVCHRNWTHAISKGTVKIVTLAQYAELQGVAA